MEQHDSAVSDVTECHSATCRVFVAFIGLDTEMYTHFADSSSTPALRQKMRGQAYV
jgi:hypothetical protein